MQQILGIEFASPETGLPSVPLRRGGRRAGCVIATVLSTRLLGPSAKHHAGVHGKAEQ
jgi:hypothetical protein